MKIASWNVNSIKSRLPIVVDWLRTAKPDVLLLQELKTTEDQFPRLEIEAEGYQCAVAGQKTYNGVAILSKRPMQITRTALPGDPDDAQARYIEATIDPGVRVAAIYLPNGNPVGTDKYAYKLAWMERLRRHAKETLKEEIPFVFGGDYNIAPQDADVHAPEKWQDDALCRPESRAAYRRIVHLGLTEAFRAVNGEAGRYSWWDYQGGSWSRDQGLRIDLLLLSPQAADLLEDAGIDKTPRGREKPSDHTPVWCRLAEAG